MAGTHQDTHAVFSVDYAVSDIQCARLGMIDAAGDIASGLDMADDDAAIHVDGSATAVFLIGHIAVAGYGGVIQGLDEGIALYGNIGTLTLGADTVLLAQHIAALDIGLGGNGLTVCAGSNVAHDADADILRADLAAQEGELAAIGDLYAVSLIPAAILHGNDSAALVLRGGDFTAVVAVLHGGAVFHRQLAAIDGDGRAGGDFQLVAV